MDYFVVYLVGNADAVCSCVFSTDDPAEQKLTKRTFAVILDDIQKTRKEKVTILNIIKFEED